MSKPTEPAHQEIIIIKRGSEEEEGHHGGAWKIAFADFMTAMMALFLVLWLINAANEETKRAVASYFNPVKLVDRNRSAKGLEEQKGGPTNQSDEGSEPGNGLTERPANENDAPDSKSTPQKKSSRVIDEQSFFADPNNSIEAIGSTGTMNKSDTAVLSGSDDSDFSDPFAPDFWKRPGKEKSHQTEDSSKSSTAGGTTMTNSGNEQIKGKEPDESQQAKSTSAAETLTPETLKATINKTLHESSTEASEIASSIHVENTEQGTLISVTDTIKRPMFAVGSAVPEASMVTAIDAIAKALSEVEGDVRIFGHTDARPFSKQGMSNWKLSTDRSNAAYLMLLHGGLAEKRISEIAGFADRKLKNPGNPHADENRRIEILLVQR